MHGKLAWFLTLAVFSGLSMNLILRFGIGLQRIALEEDGEGAFHRDSGENAKWVFLVWLGIYFVSVMLLWLFFSILQSVLFLGFLEYIMIFPVSSLLFTGIEYLARRLLLKTGWRSGAVSLYLMEGAGGAFNNAAFNGGLFNASMNGAMVGAALFVMLGLAGGFAEAATLSFGFSVGAALAVLVVGETRRRSAVEAVPRRLRGGPLVLIIMGLLSLVCMSVATVFYAVLGAN
jgi:Na+-translocating ferredoxin:NAD+ oxidoreductase subunit A